MVLTMMVPSALEADVVVCQCAGEHRPIDIGDAVAVRLIVAVPDLAHDPELARIDRALEHAGGERRHAVVQRDRRSAASHLDGVDADLDVEPLVAVDDVIAGPARDGVAAVATEDDVSTVERSDSGAEDLLQAGDESDALLIQSLPR